MWATRLSGLDEMCGACGQQSSCYCMCLCLSATGLVIVVALNFVTPLAFVLALLKPPCVPMRAMLLALPTELLQGRILPFSGAGALGRSAATCTRLAAFVAANEIWRLLYDARWPPWISNHKMTPAPTPPPPQIAKSKKAN